MAPLLTGLQHLLGSFAEIRLGYLSLNRPSGTLSGGEAQRTKMIRHLGSSLTDVTYVFDEPTIGLHPLDIERMNDLLLRLRDKGNTVLVVEHSPRRSRSPTTSSTSAPAPARRAGRLLRGHCGRAKGERHHHRAPSRQPGRPQGDGADALSHAVDPRRSAIKHGFRIIRWHPLNREAAALSWAAE